jgi:putative DNA primase/helicase
MSKERKEYRKKLDNVPDELKTLPNWVCYRIEERYGQPKPTKVPYDPTSGDRAKANDPSTWTDYETCVAAVERGKFDGIGFEFGSGYVGIDLDHCRDVKTGQIEDWACDMVAHLDSYTEASPSGSGVHIICKGTLPEGRRRMGPIEMYDTARFFTVTGEHIPGTALTVGERSAELGELHEALFAEEVPYTATDARVPGPAPGPSSLSDAEIIERASAAANGDKFRELWAGNWEGDYASQSEADEALCCHLAFWTGKDADRMDILFRESGLLRPKWEQREEYRRETISRAINRTAETFTMSRRERLEKLYTSLAAQTSTAASLCVLSAPDRQEVPVDEPSTPVSDFEDFRYSLTDLGNSERFIRQHSPDLRYCVQTATWHIWSGTRWESDTLDQVHQLGKATVRRIYDELALEPDPDKCKALFKFIQKSESERSLNALVNLSRTDPGIAVTVTVFDTQPHLLNCVNGTIDLRTGELLPHRREDLLTKQCPVVYDAGATSQLWENFLNDCTRGDRELQGFLQPAVGYTLYGDPREQVILMVNGPGGTGKSTFISAIQSILADYASTADFSTFLKKDRVTGGASDDVASLAGARLVSSIEVDQGQKLAEALLSR